jgi:hypothetical protein
MLRRCLFLLFAWPVVTACDAVAPADPSNSPDDDAGYGGSLGPEASSSTEDSPIYAPRVDGSVAYAYDAGISSPSDVQTGPPFDAGPDGICSGALAPGSLAIDELMIASTSGTGDYGEWLEVESTVGCAIDVKGLRGECPHENTLVTFDVSYDLWIPAYGTFLVADSSDPAINHDLPGPLVAWAGEPGDVLRNEGATITLLMNQTMIDSLTYPSLKLIDGTTVSFPSDCLLADRSDWTAWQPSTLSWFPGFFGTPNAPNTDVFCVSQ